MKMKPKTCYLWHADKTKRLHIPVYTHPHCFLLVDGEQFHIPADGKAVVVDTTKMHTALNASKIDRIHIVGAFSKSFFRRIFRGTLITFFSITSDEKTKG